MDTHRYRSTAARAAQTLAAAADAFPLTPQNVAQRIIDRFHDRRAARAAGDPTWAAIQQRRHRDGSELLTLRSDDLSWADWETQREIEHRLTPDPWWLPAVRRVADARPTRPLRHVRHAGQRIRRGWDDTSTYDLGGSITAQLADQLEHLAATTHGWPDSEKYPTFESWTAELRHHATQLRRWGGSPEQRAALDRWHALATDTAADAAAMQHAWETLQALEIADTQAATAAMHWVADHLGTLWD
jgi:hypothetical protein